MCSMSHCCSKRHRKSRHFYGHYLNLLEPWGSRYCISSVKQQPSQMVKTIWKSFWYERHLLLPAGNLEVRTRQPQLCCSSQKHTAAACPPHPATTEGGRSGSKPPPKHIPALQHTQGSHSAQRSLWDGHSTMTNFPTIQEEMQFSFYFM